MNKIFIIDIHKNPGLLKFTQTKIFFDAKNQGVEWAYDCEVVDSLDQIKADKGIIINSGEFITTTFRSKFQSVDQLIDARGDSDLIQFTNEYAYDMKTKPPYEQGSKQLYILENLYKVVLKSRKLVYLENTEPFVHHSYAVDHFYGLASGWKSVQLVKDIGIKNLKSITIYDKCKRQLEYQQYLHSLETLPESVEMTAPVCGTYNPPTDLKEFWKEWHSTKVEFVNIDLFDQPVFQKNSLIWVSNVFKYEPTIFEKGWEVCKMAQLDLKNLNTTSTII
jgi:hypothetical protein